MKRLTNIILRSFDTIDLQSIEQKLGVHIGGNEILIPLFGKPHKVSKSGVTDPSGKQPPLYICVILFKYLLLCSGCLPGRKRIGHPLKILRIQAH